MDINGKKALVTGVTGFVGSKIATRLLEEGAKVRGLVREKTNLPNIDQFVGDLTDTVSLQKAVEGVDYVVHTAVSYSGDFHESRMIDVEGTQALAEVAFENGVDRFIHISTCGVYNVDNQTLVTEDTPFWDYDEEGEYVYGMNKAETERVLRKVMQKGLNAVILRPAAILGPHKRSAWGYRFAKRIKNAEVIIGGDGNNPWPYVVVDNLVDAIMLVIKNPQAVGRAYTIIDGHKTWREFTDPFAGWFKVELEYGPKRKPYDYFMGRFSCKRARNELGYSPKKSYQEVMEETYQFLKDNGMLED